MTIQPAAMNAITRRNVAAERRSAGNAGAIIGVKKKNGEPSTSGDCVTKVNVAVVAARKISAACGSGVPRALMYRITASIAIMTS